MHLKHTRALIIGLLGFFVVIASPAGGQMDPMAIIWWSIDSGGQTSRSSTFSVHGVIGQPDAAESGSSRFQLASGFLNSGPSGTNRQPVTNIPLGNHMVYLPTYIKGPTPTPGPTPEPELPPEPIPASWQLVAGSDRVEGGQNGFTSLKIVNRRLVAGARQEPINGAGFYSSMGELVAPCSSLPSIERVENEVRIYDIEFFENTLYVATYTDKLDISLDVGATWENFSGKIADNAQARSIAVFDRRLYVATQSHGLYFSDDGGLNWSSKVAGISDELNTITVNSGSVWVGTVANGVQAVDLNGANVSSVGALQAEVFAFSFDGSTAYIGTNQGVYRSQNRGGWEVFGTGLENQDVLSIASANNKIYAGTSNGVWSIPAAEPTSAWQQENDASNLGGRVVRDLMVDTSICSGLFAATDRGIFYLPNQ